MTSHHRFGEEKASIPLITNGYLHPLSQPTCSKMSQNSSTTITSDSLPSKPSKKMPASPSGSLLLCTQYRLVACVPAAVLGGAGMMLFGTVAASGIRTLAKVNYTNNMNLVIVAIALNLLFNHMSVGNSDQQSVFVAGAERILHESDIACLNDGDRVVGGRLFDADGREASVIPDGHTMPRSSQETATGAV